MGNPTKRSSKKSPKYSPEIDDIPDDEKMRLIKESGIFKTLKQAETDRQEQSLTEVVDDPFAYVAISYTQRPSMPLQSS